MKVPRFFQCGIAHNCQDDDEGRGQKWRESKNYEGHLSLLTAPRPGKIKGGKVKAVGRHGKSIAKRFKGKKWKWRDIKGKVHLERKRK